MTLSYQTRVASTDAYLLFFLPPRRGKLDLWCPHAALECIKRIVLRDNCKTLDGGYRLCINRFHTHYFFFSFSLAERQQGGCLVKEDALFFFFFLSQSGELVSVFCEEWHLSCCIFCHQHWGEEGGLGFWLLNRASSVQRGPARNSCFSYGGPCNTKGLGMGGNKREKKNYLYIWSALNLFEKEDSSNFGMGNLTGSEVWWGFFFFFSFCKVFFSCCKIFCEVWTPEGLGLFILMYKWDDPPPPPSPSHLFSVPYKVSDSW